MENLKNSIHIEDQGRQIALDSSNYSYLNLGTGERVLSTVAGVILTTCGAYLTNKHSRSGEGQSWYEMVSIPVGMYLIKRGLTGYCALNNTVGRNTAEKEDFEPIEIDAKLQIKKPRREVYNLWRNLENLPSMISHLKKVEVLDDKQSEWTICIPDTFLKVKWKAEIVEEVPNEKISWQSVEGSDIGNNGEIRFTDLSKGRGTEVQVAIRYLPPAGKLGKGVAGLFSSRFRKILSKELESVG